MPYAILNQNSLHLPDTEALRISIRAAEIAQRLAPRGPKGSASKIRPTPIKGQVGLYIPQDAIHLIYLDKGFKPFIMWSLEGKTIPIRGPDGRIHFRKAVGVGQHRITVRDSGGRIVSSDIKWRHPGVKPMWFLERALQQALKEWNESLKDPQNLRNALRGTAIGDFLSFIEKLGQ